MPDASNSAEIIAVGSEMLTTQRLDTNSLFIADQLNALGVEVRRKLVVGDDRAIVTDAVRDALQHASIVIVTGGLGPTEDDLTREAVAQALGRTLIFRQELADAIEERFRRFRRKMSSNNHRQAMLIDGAEALPNPNGTAAGQWIEPEVVEGAGRIVMLLPGPPGELKPMFVSECVPRLASRLPAQVIRARLYRVTGMGESDLDHLISPVYSKYTNPTTTILASPGDIQIHLRARCDSEAEAERLLAEVGNPIEELLGERVFSRNGDSLEATVGGLLRARGATLAVAESCTGGLIAERVTSVPGSSDYFAGGFIVYSNKMKENLLGIDPAMIAEHTAVSGPVACAMAERARTLCGAAYALSVTGEAGPGSSTGAPVGTVFLGVAEPDGAVSALKFTYPGDRNRIRLFAAQGALDYLRRRMLAQA